MKTALFTHHNGALQIQPKSSQLDFEKVQLVLCFGDKTAIAETNPYQLLHSMFPNAAITICSAAGAIVNTSVEDRGFTVTAIQFEKTTVQSHVVNIADYKCSYEAGFNLMKKIDAADTKFIFLLSDGQKVNGSELIRGINEANTTQIPVSGGLAADGYNFVSTLTGINAAPGEGNIIAIALCGSQLQNRAVDVLMKAHELRVERGDHHIADEHVADAIEALLATRPRLPVGEKAAALKA